MENEVVLRQKPSFTLEAPPAGVEAADRSFEPFAPARITWTRLQRPRWRPPSLLNGFASGSGEVEAEPRGEATDR